VSGAELQRFGGPNQFLVRIGTAEGTEASAAVAVAVERVAGRDGYRIERSEGIGPKVGSELRQQAATAILLSFVATLAYLAYRFEWRFGLAAIVATAHDILATIAFIAVLRLEFSLIIVAAILTVVGYSLNDTIVIFDRVRENLRRPDREGFVALLNRSVNETLPRTVLTGGTGLATLIALAIFGGDVIRPFALVMFFGIFTGTFSSIFIAAPVLLWIERRWPGAGRSIFPAPSPRSPAPAPAGSPAG
jgi:preprotein translocase subunit SecF